MELRLFKEGVRIVVFVRLCGTLDHCWRNGILQLQFSSRTMDEMDGAIFHIATQQLSYWRSRCWYRVNPVSILSLFLVTIN